MNRHIEPEESTMRSFAAWLIALAVAAGQLSGCGSDDAAPATRDDRASASRTSAAPAASPNLDQYLLQVDEGPGLEPMSSPQTDSEEPFPLPEGGAETLERSGYISTTYQTGVGDSIAGVSSVLLFETEAGASDWMTYETSAAVLRHQIPDGKFTWFQVSDVPGAAGWTGPDLHGNAIGSVYWTQGRCMMLISVETGGPRVEPLSAGAKAIYERTGGTCPD
jgi:hypothetical protein